MTDPEARAFLNYIHGLSRLLQAAYERDPPLRVETPEQADVWIEKWLTESRKD